MTSASGSTTAEVPLHPKQFDLSELGSFGVSSPKAGSFSDLDGMISTGIRCTVSLSGARLFSLSCFSMINVYVFFSRSAGAGSQTTGDSVGCFVSPRCFSLAGTVSGQNLCFNKVSIQ